MTTHVHAHTTLRPLPLQHDASTSDPCEAHLLLEEYYAAKRVKLSHHIMDGPFRFGYKTLMAGDDFSVTRCTNSISACVDSDPLGYLLIGNLLGGSLEVQVIGGFDRTELHPHVGDLVMFDPNLPMRTEWDNWTAGTVRVHQRVIEKVAEEHLGHAVEVRFGLSTTISSQWREHWQWLVKYLVGDFCKNPLVYRSAIIRAQTMRMLGATVLEAFPNSFHEIDPDRQGDADPSVVRRAQDFIDLNAGDPIGLLDIAGVARVGTRSLQSAFRRHLDTTPMAYLRQVRYDRAHEDLMAADPATTTVAEVATRWGFTHMGRFSTEYRRRFGHAPSDVLRG